VIFANFSSFSEENVSGTSEDVSKNSHKTFHRYKM
jgi:hypothetical protein